MWAINDLAARSMIVELVMNKHIRWIFAPNVHTGGGIALLKMILALSSTDEVNLILDSRSKPKITELNLELATFFQPTILGRLAAEIKLSRCKFKGEVLCFHNLPPLLPFHGYVTVFFQNVSLFNFNRLASDRIFVRFRTLMERALFNVFKSRVDRFIVQTQSVKNLLITKAKVDPEKIQVLPFGDCIHVDSAGRQGLEEGFLYVADGAGHKNHLNLINAWSLLRKQGFSPTLKLTLGDRDKELWLQLKRVIDEQGLNVENVGNLPLSELEILYRSSEALIFPSVKESFGMPLIEAQRFGLPVIAAELDYVRDVCCPVETFDPSSPLSISRAIRRFKGWGDDRVEIATPEEFMRIVFHDR